MKNSPSDFRIGFGFDIHRLVEGRELILGGIVIPHIKGSLGHSDADALIHAICDALLGAANLRDIGFHFPDTSPEFEGIDSKIFLEKVTRLIRKKGFELGNLDATVCLEKPKITAYIPDMKKMLAKCIATEEDNISIKATTFEGMGFVGREEGVIAYAVVSLFTSPPSPSLK